MNDIILDSIQIALFPKNLEIKKTLSVYNDLIKAKLIVENNAVINTFLDDTPPNDIIRIEANLDEKGDKRIYISPKKISLFSNNLSKKPDFSIDIDDSIDKVKKICNTLTENPIFNRVGFITNLYTTTTDPIKQFKEKYIPEKKDINLRAIETTLTYDADIKIPGTDSIKCNKLARLRTGELSSDPTKKLIAIQYDINTHQTNDLNWDLDKVSLFLQEANKMSDCKNIYSEFFYKTV